MFSFPSNIVYGIVIHTGWDKVMRGIDDAIRCGYQPVKVLCVVNMPVVLCVPNSHMIRSTVW